ncbi:MAG: response regulator, partial [Treponema sp.]|nr:response regulator [Treponema sp.]
KNTFEKIGVSVDTYGHGGEFLTGIDRENYDLIFLDLLMPNVDGFEVLKSLAGHKESPPVIVLSSITQRDTVVRAFQMGIKSYLTKPLKPQDIFKRAIEILEPDF